MIDFEPTERGGWRPVDARTRKGHVCVGAMPLNTEVDPVEPVAATPVSDGRRARPFRRLLPAAAIIFGIGALGALAMIDKQTAAAPPTEPVAAATTTTTPTTTSAANSSDLSQSSGSDYSSDSSPYDSGGYDSGAGTGGAPNWSRSCYPAWRFEIGCYDTYDSYLVDSFADWIGECLPGDTSSCEQDARDYYADDCYSSAYASDCEQILDALVADGRMVAQQRGY